MSAGECSKSGACCNVKTGECTNRCNVNTPGVAQFFPGKDECPIVKPVVINCGYFHETKHVLWSIVIFDPDCQNTGSQGQ